MEFDLIFRQISPKLSHMQTDMSSIRFDVKCYWKSLVTLFYIRSWIESMEEIIYARRHL